MLNISLVEDAYQYSLSVEYKLKRRNKGSFQGKEKQDDSTKDKPSVVGESKPLERKKRIGRGEFKTTFFFCRGEGHRAFWCPQKSSDRRHAIVNKAKDHINEPKVELGEICFVQQVFFSKKALEPC